MDAKQQKQIATLYRRYTETTERSEQRKLFAALADVLTTHFLVEERILRSRQTLALAEFRAHYLAAKGFSELLRLEVGHPMFAARLRKVCTHLGAVPASEERPEILQAA